MIIMPETVKHIECPWVSSLYVKRGLRGEEGREDVLVIEVRSDEISKAKDYKTILSELQTVCWQAEQQVGAFDRVDLRVS
jgi:hypothetical protein